MIYYVYRYIFNKKIKKKKILKKYLKLEMKNKEN